jgi:hypothetical protein
MTIDCCDFQVPPEAPGWYGILSEDRAGNVLHQAACWTGIDWSEYPVRAYARSLRAFRTEAAALDWTRPQPDSIWRTP